MKKPNSHLLLKLEALAARTPTSPEHTSEMLKYVMTLLKHQFEAYLIDIMWEDNQGKNVELRAVQMIQTEDNNFTSRKVYLKNRSEPDSLTGWCYVNSTPVWIVDENGLKRGKSYKNLVHNVSGGHATSTVPKGTIYEYNKEKIRTEICIPLRTKISDKWTRTAGVLNIETTHVMRPSTRAKDIVFSSSKVIEQVQNRLLALRSAEEWSAREMRELRQIGDSFEREGRSQTSLILSAFVARPFSSPNADAIYRWIVEELTRRGIRVLEIETNELIVPAIFEAIQACHFGIVVSTGFNPNVILEWGYFLGCDKPVIRLHQNSGNGESDPFDVAGMMRFEYAKAGNPPTERGVRVALGRGLHETMKKHRDLAELLPNQSRKGR